MKPRFLLPLLAVLFATTSAFAGRYGSETLVTLSGTYHLAGSQTDKKLKGGDVSKTTAYKIQKVSNSTVLSALKKRGLITTTTGYSLVMVGQTHTADGIKFFAIANGQTPVAIPTDILNLTLNDGPRAGTLVVDKNSVLKTLSAETRNQATLTLGSFSGSGIVVQSWTSKPVVKSGITEVVELMESKGRISGVISTSTNSGVGVIDLGLTKSKTVDLKRYGMATSSSTGSFGGSTSLGAVASVTTTTPTLTNSSLYISVIQPGIDELTLTGLNTYTGSTLTQNGVLWVNPTITSTPDIGLTLAFDGNVLALPAYGIGQPNELTITTADGPVVFTRENGNIWTPVTAATPAVQ